MKKENKGTEKKTKCRGGKKFPFSGEHLEGKQLAGVGKCRRGGTKNKYTKEGEVRATQPS